MSFIGRTHGVYNGQDISTIDYLEKPGMLVENIKDNLYAPLILASVCKKLKCHFTYLGTGCIFNYDDKHPNQVGANGFKESDVPNFFGSSYSIVKGYTDRLMHDLYDNHVLNIRIRMPITSEVNPRNFITKITKYDKICSIANSMTVLDDLLPIMVHYAVSYKTGTYNFTNPGVITHDDILTMYKEIVDPNFTWKNFSIEEQDAILASKRSNNALDTTKIEQTTPTVKPIKLAISDALQNMKRAFIFTDPAKDVVPKEVEPLSEHAATESEPIVEPLEATTATESDPNGEPTVEHTATESEPLAESEPNVDPLEATTTTESEPNVDPLEATTATDSEPLAESEPIVETAEPK
jgi:3,5-epimerase/4-reductase